MIVHADEVPVLANHITEALYARLESGRATRVNVLPAAPQLSAAIEIVEQALLPFDFHRFPKATRRLAPLVTLPPQRLFIKFAEGYIFAQLCEAIVLSFTAGNGARMRAMIAARPNVHNTLEQLIGDFRRRRHEEITLEIVELSSDSVVANDVRRKPRPKS